MKRTFIYKDGDPLITFPISFNSENKELNETYLKMLTDLYIMYSEININNHPHIGYFTCSSCAENKFLPENIRYIIYKSLKSNVFIYSNKCYWILLDPIYCINCSNRDDIEINNDIDNFTKKYYESYHSIVNYYKSLHQINKDIINLDLNNNKQKKKKYKTQLVGINTH